MFLKEALYQRHCIFPPFFLTAQTRSQSFLSGLFLDFIVVYTDDIFQAVGAKGETVKDSNLR